MTIRQTPCKKNHFSAPRNIEATEADERSAACRLVGCRWAMLKADLSDREWFQPVSEGQRDFAHDRLELHSTNKFRFHDGFAVSSLAGS